MVSIYNLIEYSRSISTDQDGTKGPFPPEGKTDRKSQGQSMSAFKGDLLTWKAIA